MAYVKYIFFWILFLIWICAGLCSCYYPKHVVKSYKKGYKVEDDSTGGRKYYKCDINRYNW